ncbi:hypothetical protein F5Y16DRAFT_74251 [Xylariaceae sp. FL0255]|nr:hypothetical protein F5Y16DRAFT_74251 [Xylariaceae sp. FL0255]
MTADDLLYESIRSLPSLPFCFFPILIFPTHPHSPFMWLIFSLPTFCVCARAMSLDQISSLPIAEQQATLKGPALTPPTGVTPDLANPPNENTLGLAAILVCLSIASLAVILRAGSRLLVTKTLRLEDYLALAAFGTYIGYVYLNFRLLYEFGFFVHQWDIPVKSLAPITWLVTVGSTLYAVTEALLKSAILREFCHIFVPKHTRNAFWIASHVLIVLNILFYFGTAIFVTLFACSPRQKIWDKSIPGGHCINTEITFLVSAAINVISDIVILVLPQKIIWNLNMPTKTKVGVSALFAVGALTCVAAIIRLVSTVTWYESEDKIYTLAPITLWAIAEMICMFLVFCLPTIPKACAALGIGGPIARLVTRLRSWLTLPFNKASNSAQSEPSNTSYDVVLRKDKYSAINASRDISDNVMERRGLVPKSGILYTKHFTTSEGQAQAGIEAERVHLEHHPWVGNGN